VAIEAGQQLLHYRLIEKIGEGGMGVVWKAEDTKLHRRVAVKVLPEAMAADPERRTRFEREARAVAALNHPNIVTLHSVEEAETPAGSVHFITMELVEGRTLTQLLPKRGFPLNPLLQIGIPLADAVSRAHRAGITHRDLKPDNIMIDGKARLRVLDFGLAKLHEASGPTQDTQTATVNPDTAEGRMQAGRGRRWRMLCIVREISRRRDGCWTAHWNESVTPCGEPGSRRLARRSPTEATRAPCISGSLLCLLY